MTFSDDIKSKHLTNYVLVTIGRIEDVPLGTCVISSSDGTTANSYPNISEEECLFNWCTLTETQIHRLSTQKVTLDGHYYKPLLLDIPSLSESLDIENRKYKISSVRLSISDYEEDGVRFSDSLNLLMNKEVNIWYASQSSKVLEYPDCYKAGSYIIRNFNQDQDKINLSCEDLSQDKLHKDLPLGSIDYNDRTIPIPIIFGYVDRSPCVYNGDKWIFEETPIISSSEVQSFIGNHDLKGSSIYVRVDNDYLNLRSIAESDEEFSNTMKSDILQIQDQNMDPLSLTSNLNNLLSMSDNGGL